jgi:hypothetical protein
MKDVMLDIETMGTGISPPIVSIGAVKFDLKTGETGEEFYVNIDLADSMKNGFSPDGDTILWWFNQSEEARKHLFDPTPIGVKDALKEFAVFCKGLSVWGNGSNFDNRIVRNAYSKMYMDTPWHFRNDMDVRTLVYIGKLMGIKKDHLPFTGVKHHALHDAINQVQYCSYIYQHIIGKTDA